MPTPAPTKPGDASPVPDDDDHGGKLAKLFRDLEKDEVGNAPAPAPESRAISSTSKGHC
jgi:hypothetical protein